MSDDGLQDAIYLMQGQPFSYGLLDETHHLDYVEAWIERLKCNDQGLAEQRLAIYMAMQDRLGADPLLCFLQSDLLIYVIMDHHFY